VPAPDQITAAQQVVDVMSQLDPAQLGFLRQFFEQRIISRRGQAFAVNMAVRSVDILNAATGGNGLALSNPVQRAWRDINAVGRHVSVNWDAVATMYGQMALGLEPRGQY